MSNDFKKPYWDRFPDWDPDKETLSEYLYRKGDPDSTLEKRIANYIGLFLFWVVFLLCLYQAWTVDLSGMYVRRYMGYP